MKALRIIVACFGMLLTSFGGGWSLITTVATIRTYTFWGITTFDPEADLWLALLVIGLVLLTIWRRLVKKTTTVKVSGRKTPKILTTCFGILAIGFSIYGMFALGWRLGLTHDYSQSDVVYMYQLLMIVGFVLLANRNNFKKDEPMDAAEVDFVIPSIVDSVGKTQIDRESEPALDSSVAVAINQANIETKKKKRRKIVILIVIVSILVAVAIPVGISANNKIVAEKVAERAAEEAARIEDAKARYVDDVETFSMFVNVSGSSLREIVDIWDEVSYIVGIGGTVYWDVVHSDLAELHDSVDENHSSVTSAYTSAEWTFKEMLDDVEDDNLSQIYNAADALYNSYMDYYNFAGHMAGGYSSLSSEVDSKTDDLIAKSKVLKIWLERYRNSVS
jgi:hypothetical protein